MRNLTCLLLLVLTLNWLSAVEEYRVTTAEWVETGHGNHRVLVEVDAAGTYHVDLKWRRLDLNPERKGIRVLFDSTGEPVRNVYWSGVTDFGGDLIFEAAYGPGKYGIYYLPYDQPSYFNFMWPTDYDRNVNYASAKWLTASGILKSDQEPLGAALGGEIIRRGDKKSEFSIKNKVYYDSIKIDLPLCFQKLKSFKSAFNVMFENDQEAMLRVTLVDQGYAPPGIPWRRGYLLTLKCKNSKIDVHLEKMNPDGAIVGIAAKSINIPAQNGVRTLRVSSKVDVDGAATALSILVDGNEALKEPLKIEHRDQEANRYQTGSHPTFMMNHGLGAEVPTIWISDYELFDVTNNESIFSKEDSNQNKVSADGGTAAPQKITWDRFKKVRSAVYQARGDFNNPTPMGIPASPLELKNFTQQAANKKWHFFLEDRKNQVRSPDFLPQKWFLDKAATTFQAEARPGEYYPFQVALWAPNEEIKGVTFNFRDLKGKGVIPKAAWESLYHTRIESTGEVKTVSSDVQKGKLQTYWVAIKIPEDASGVYESTVDINSTNGAGQSFEVKVNVAGAALKNSGDDDLWRLSRLRWLNSSLHTNSQVAPVAPYQSIVTKGKEVDLLNRKIRLADDGLPESIVINGKEVLAQTINFLHVIQSKKVAYEKASNLLKLVTSGEAFSTYRSTQKSELLSQTAETKVDFDGVMDVDILVEAKEKIDSIESVLEIKMPTKRAPYFMGFGEKGGKRKKSVEWKWDKMRANNVMWMGEVEAGLGLRLLSNSKTFDMVALENYAGYQSWHNEGKGGATVFEEGENVKVYVKTGAYALQKGEKKHFNFRLYATPFKPIDPDHWKKRIAWDQGGNVSHCHHGWVDNPHINYPFLHLDHLKKLNEGERKRGQYILQVYYTLRELSTRAFELFAFRSFGEEFVKKSSFNYAPEGGVFATGGGYSYLQEQFVSDYAPGWLQVDRNSDVDSAIATTSCSRLENFYIEGARYMKSKIGNYGVYLDGIAFGRETMKRMYRVLSENNQMPWISMHCADLFGFADLKCNVLLVFMDHLPFAATLMNGEGFNYDSSLDYWLIEFSGIPFGLTNQFYDQPGPTRPFHSFVMMGASCLTPDGAVIRQFWDKIKIEEFKVSPFWSDAPLARTNVEEVACTCYTKEGCIVIAIANWSDQAQKVELRFDEKQLDGNLADYKISLPELAKLQKEGTVDLRKIELEPRGGKIIVLQR